MTPPVARKQLAVPQLYPDGQHPEVATRPSDGHSDHPPAHDPAVVVVGTAVRGTTTVAVPELMVVSSVAGQERVWQSRPVWQHPPP